MSTFSQGRTVNFYPEFLLLGVFGDPSFFHSGLCMGGTCSSEFGTSSDCNE